MRSATFATGPSPTAGGGRRKIGNPSMLFMLGGGLLGVIGSFLPWLTTPMGSLSGLAGAGIWTLSAGMLALAGAFLRFRRVALAHAGIAGLTMAVLVLWQLARIAQISVMTGSWGQLLPGMGLVMVGGGGVLLLRGAQRLFATA